MRLITFSYRNAVRLGAIGLYGQEEYVLDLQAADPTLPAEMRDFLNAGAPALAAAGRVVANAAAHARIPLEDVTLCAPVPRPPKIICLGHNYFDHMGIGRTEPPEYPTFFCKTINTVIGPGQAIVIPRVTSQVDYEAELAVVIGRQARHVSEAHAWEYVAGYTLFNDVSARDYQKRTSQWMIGKSFDTFGPMGPALVTKDEIPDPGCLEMSLTVNDLELQHTNTRHMIFPIPYLITYLSDVMTLEPGDVISTGTPAKTELAQRLPPFLKPGDRVTIRMEKIGSLSNPVIAEVEDRSLRPVG